MKKRLRNALAHCLLIIRREHGLTFPETLVAGALMSGLMLGVVNVSSRMYKAFTQSQVRQQANMEARICLETIERVLSNARVNTLTISTPALTSAVPNSRIEFAGQDGSSYAIFLSSTPLNTIYLQKTSAGGTLTNTSLATHANVLSFVLDFDDPTVIHVTLQTTVRLNVSGSAESFYTTWLPERTIRMIPA